MDLDLGVTLPRPGNDEIPPIVSENFPESTRHLPTHTEGLRSSLMISEEEQSLEAAEAPLRHRHRARRELPWDEINELRNTDLARWNNGYVENMMANNESKLHKKSSKHSKKNAIHWVYGSGIGGVGSGVGWPKLKSPLCMFAGDSLMEALTGAASSIRGRKRPRDEDSDSESGSERRRVRLEEADNEFPRGYEILMNDDEALADLAGEVKWRHPVSD